MKIPVQCPKCDHDFEIDVEPQQKRAAEARWSGKRKKKKPKAKRPPGRPPKNPKPKEETAAQRTQKEIAMGSKPAQETAQAIQKKFACGICGVEHPTLAEAHRCMKICLEKRKGPAA